MESSMAHQLDSAYNPTIHEPKVRKLWEESDAFKPNFSSDKKPFSVIMPPPNANGVLHAGHLMYTVEDVAIRFARMQGRPTLWLPGTDHAGIETQYVYEKELAKRGQTRFDLGPEKFYNEVWDFTLKHQDGMLAGFKSMGFSADWSRLKFTLDEDIIDIVYDTFIKLHNDGHVYRGNRIVNWCPRCQAAFPDIETEHVDRDDAMYTLDYGSVQIATTRPETIFADVAVAVNPADERFASLLGATATIPLVDRPIAIIADEHVDPKSGTGALKVTPAHDKNDYEIGQRHNLPEITVIDNEGKLINVPEEFAGLEVLEARTAVVAALEAAGKLVKTEPLTHAIAVHDRCGTPIEPLVSEQWFLRVAELNKPVVKALEDEAVKIHPARYKRVALNWLAQEHDWCISRPGWWGIRIPVYYKTNTDPNKDNYLITKDELEAKAYFGEGNYRAETDTFDTWFSSSQWPYATLKTTSPDDFERFYPTTMMGTAREILHKWVTRMIMFSLYSTKQVPFEHVYLWGTVTDEKGQKLSKSKGNYEDPMEITAEYGTDALRMALSIGITAGNNGALYTEKIIGYRNFCNKLWNVARFVLGKLEADYSPAAPELISNADHYMARELTETNQAVTKAIEAYRFSEAGQALYSLLWDKFADRYIEYSKATLNPAMLATTLETILRLLHPIAPFVTEALWQELPWTDSQLITEQWPNVTLAHDDTKAAKFELEIAELIAKKASGEVENQLKALHRELASKENAVRIGEAKLSNDAFAQNAPPEVVDAERKRLENAKIAVKELRASINTLEESSTN